MTTPPNPPINPDRPTRELKMPWLAEDRQDRQDRQDSKVLRMPLRNDYFLTDPPPAEPLKRAPKQPNTTVDLSVRDGLDFYISDKEYGGHPATLTSDLVRVCGRVLNMLRARVGLGPVRLAVVNDLDDELVDFTNDFTEPGEDGDDTGEKDSR
jgi:hypothetical protein